MEKLVGKFKDKGWLQKILIEIIGDFLMISIGLIGAYYIRIFMM